MADFDQADIREFAVEANELLEAAENELLNAERGQSSMFYDAVFRAFHSIKGGAGMLGMPDLQTHMHKVESQWSALKGKTSLNKSESEYFLSAVDGGRRLLQGQTISFNYDGLQPVAANSVSEAGAKNPTPTSQVTPNERKSQPSEQQTSQVVAPPIAQDQNKALRSVVYAVDDEKDILSVLKDTLEDDLFEVTCFTEPDELFAAMKRKPPQVVLTDFKMPVKSGLDVLREVKRLAPDVPVIMLSGFLTKEILVASLRDGGFFGALEKPFKATDLLRECWAAVKHHETQKMVRKSINLLVYQFADLEKYLISQGKSDVANTMGRELRELLTQQRTLNTKTSGGKS